jgi:hypothetical protein
LGGFSDEGGELVELHDGDPPATTTTDQQRTERGPGTFLLDTQLGQALPDRTKDVRVVLHLARGLGDPLEVSGVVGAAFLEAAADGPAGEVVEEVGDFAFGVVAFVALGVGHAASRRARHASRMWVKAGP